MRLHDCSVSRLKRMSHKRKIICFGAGERLQQMFCSLSDLNIQDNIAFIVDNDRSKWGLYRNINGKDVVIKSPDVLKEIKEDKYIILITAWRYNEIFAQIQNLSGTRNFFVIKNITGRYHIVRFIENILKRFPLRGSIVFQGEGDTCENAVALAKYLKEEGYLKKNTIYWLCNHPEKYKNSYREKYVLRDTDFLKTSIGKQILYIIALSTSRYLIFENQMIKKRREDQISIYLNHGSPPLKATKGIINLPSNLNYAVCPSVNCADILCEQYGINKERLLYCGSPRTDILFDQMIKSSLAELLHITNYRKVVLWVPTFRQHFKNGRVDTKRQYKSGMPIVETEKDWSGLIDFLKKRSILLIIKPHLLQKIDLLKIPQNINVNFITQTDLEKLHSNVYDLMKLCDGMITDYSTIAFDYMLLDRPIGYTIDDIKEYKVGFSVSDPLALMPGEKITNLMEFILYLENIYCEKDTYAKERAAISDYIHGQFCDGNNSKRLANLVNLK